MSTGGETNTKTRSSKPQERRSQPLAAEASPAPAIEGMALGLEPVVGSTFGQETFQRHAAMLNDSALGQSANSERRAMILRQLQRDYGNRYVQRLARQARQTKEVGAATSLLESPLVQEAHEEDRSGEGYAVEPEVAARIDEQRPQGSPIESQTRREMETNLGANLGDVRVHTGPEADSLSKKVNAEAFTEGSDVFFRDGRYQPGTPEGQQLLAHELTHVLHQNGNPATASPSDTNTGIAANSPSINRATPATVEKEKEEKSPQPAEAATHGQPEGQKKAEATAPESKPSTPASDKTAGPAGPKPEAGTPQSDAQAPTAEKQDKAEAAKGPAEDTAGGKAPGPEASQEPSAESKDKAKSAEGPSEDSANGKAPSAEASAESTDSTAPSSAGTDAATPTEAQPEGAGPEAEAEATGGGAAQGADTAAPIDGGPPEGVAGASGEAGAAGGGTAGSPEEDPGFQAMVANTQAVANKEQGHSSAQSESAAAQAAAVSPPDEVASQAQANQVDELDQQPPGQFDKGAFKAALMAKIANMAPKTLGEADEFRESNKLSSVKGELTSKVDRGKEKAQGAIEEKTKEPPDTSSVKPKEVAPLEPKEPGSTPPDVGAAKAMPKPKPEAEVSAPFKQGSQKLEQQMADADVTEEQLTKSNEPQFQGALQAKQDAKADAAEAPAKFREGEQQVLSQAQADAEATAQTQTTAMHGDRAQILTQVVGSQEQAKGQDEKARAEVASHIQGIYVKTKTQVEARLTRLDAEVDTAFTAGAAQAKTAFESYVDGRMEAYKDERYSGVLGWGRWVKDKIAGMPSEVNQFYQQGRQIYIAQMDGVIDNVVNIVGAGLTEAKAIVSQGRQEISEYVASLPQSLQSVGQEAAADIQSQFTELEQNVDDKQTELIDSLAQRYQNSVQEVDSRIEELKASNAGLVDKAINAVAGVINTISKLKDMLLGVLSKAGSVISGIISDPIGFLGNLVSGIKQGLDNFVSNIGTHLEKGLVSWLTGAIASTGIEMPEKFDLKGIFSLVMQVLGLTYDNIRGLAVKVLGDKVVGALETTFDIFKALASEGITGLWGFIQDKVGDLKTLVMDKIKEILTVEVIKAGIKWIIGLLSPAGAFIKACKAIYDIIMFFVERGSQIMELVNAVISSVGAIVKGNIGGAAKLVENALAKAVPVAIGFLASLLGLGNIAEKVQGIFEIVQKPIKKAIGWVLGKAKGFAKKMGGKLGLGKKDEEKLDQPGPGEDGEEDAGAESESAAQGVVTKTFKIGKESHTLFAPLTGEQDVEMASVRRQDLEIIIQNALKTDPAPAEEGELNAAKELVGDLEAKQSQIEERKQYPTRRKNSGESGGEPGKLKPGKPNILDYRKDIEIILDMIAGTLSKVRLKETADDKMHQSVHVIGEVTPGKEYMLDPNVATREKLYGGWAGHIEAWKQKRYGEINGKCPECGEKKPIGEFDIDHDPSVADHWTKYGKDQNQDDRKKWYSDTGHLDLLCASCNRGKGSGGSYIRPIVGPAFKGPGDK